MYSKLHPHYRFSNMLRCGWDRFLGATVVYSVGICNSLVCLLILNVYSRSMQQAGPLNSLQTLYISGPSEKLFKNHTWNYHVSSQVPLCYLLLIAPSYLCFILRSEQQSLWGNKCIVFFMPFNASV